MKDTFDPAQDIFEGVDIRPVEYGGFWIRVGAIFIDGIVFVPLMILDTHNHTTWKNLGLLFLFFLIGICYKPFMEYKFGATLGKMATELKVVDYHLQKASLLHITLRNVFDIAYRLALFFITLAKYLDPNFQNVNNFIDYNEMQVAHEYNVPLFLVYPVIAIFEIILLLTDTKKRTLHDRIGKTMVIKKKG